MGNVIQWNFGRKASFDEQALSDTAIADLTLPIPSQPTHPELTECQSWIGEPWIWLLHETHYSPVYDKGARVESVSVTPKDVKRNIGERVGDALRNLFWGAPVSNHEEWALWSLINGPFPQIQKWINNTGIDMIAIETTRMQHRMHERDLEDIKGELDRLTLNEDDFNKKPKYFTALFFEHRARTGPK